MASKKSVDIDIRQCHTHAQLTVPLKPLGAPGTSSVLRADRATMGFVTGGGTLTPFAVFSGIRGKPYRRLGTPVVVPQLRHPRCGTYVSLKPWLSWGKVHGDSTFTGNTARCLTYFVERIRGQCRRAHRSDVCFCAFRRADGEGMPGDCFVRARSHVCP